MVVVGMKSWLLRKLLKNLGKVADGVYRSGQPGFIRRVIMYWIIQPKTRINLAFSPGKDRQDMAELQFLVKRGVEVHTFAWSAGGVTNIAEAMRVLYLLNNAARPIWIGCEGGKDRTGGIIGYWKKQGGCTLGEIIEDFRRHKVPAEGWLEFVFGF